MRRVRTLFAMVIVLALVAAACGGGEETGGETTTSTTEATTTTTEATTTTTEAVAIGTPENPIKVLYVPSVSAEEIVAGGELLKQELEKATGLTFEVFVPTSYAAVVEEMCASPENTMGFIPAQAYVLANQLCGVEVSLKAIRFGYDVYWTQFITQRDRDDIQTLADLDGKTWAYPDATSTSGFLVPSGMMKQLGIEPSDSFEAGGHSATVRAVYNGEADFGTTFYSPPIDAEGNSLWQPGEDPDVPADLIDTCGLDENEDLVCTDGERVYRPRDARRNIRKEAPDVIQKVKIVAVSDPIPNDTLSFGPEFPEDLKQQIVDALVAFAENDPEGFATAFDAYSWTGVAPTNDAEFDFIRQLIQELGITLEDL